MMKSNRTFIQTKLGLLPEDWIVKRISDIFEIKAGGDLKKLDFSKTKQEGFNFPVYSNSLNDKGLYGFSKTYQYDKDCVTITARGDVGHAEYRNHQFCAIVRLLVLKPKIDISGYFIANFINSKLNFSHVGAAVNQLTAPQISNELIAYPSNIEERQKIVTILSNYDSQIKINKRRIQILENISKLIYEEWFVKFKFPGHESVKMIDSKTDFGKIPEGWEVGNVEEIASIQRGVSYKSSELAEEESIPFVNLKCMLPGGEGGFRSSGLKRYNGKYKEVQKLIPGDIVMGITEMTQKREIIARPARIPEMNEKEITFSMDLVKIIPKESISKDWLYSFFKYSSFGIEVKEFANGVNVLHLNPQHIINYKMVIPSKDIMEKFINSISKLFILNDNLQLKNQNLLKTRDLLLPRLISGEMDVSELNIKLPEIEV